MLTGPQHVVDAQYPLPFVVPIQELGRRYAMSRARVVLPGIELDNCQAFAAVPCLGRKNSGIARRRRFPEVILVAGNGAVRMDIRIADKSEERRVGKEGGSTCRFWW